MTGLERIRALLSGGVPDAVPVFPIIHSGLAPLFGVPLGKFFTDPDAMAEVIVRGYRDFGWDGVQLSLGVTAEAEAFGARVEQPENAPPALKQHVLAGEDFSGLLRSLDCAGLAGKGRFPLFSEAVRRVVREIGSEAFVLVTLRGPLLMAAQLRGAERVLLDTIDFPEQLDALLDFTVRAAHALGRSLLDAGAHGVMLGEAACSPSFISPAAYRRFVFAKHVQLVHDLKAAGWNAIGLHVCGGIIPILEDLVSTGADIIDVDYQVPADEALKINRGRAVLRGNLDPSTVFAFGTPASAGDAAAELASRVSRGSRWIFSSGCDLSPGTPAENIRCAVTALRSSLTP
ncbi:MAG TPA: hypothetical protein ENN09_04435 [Planctomycetes bacterium]|nr:hypothetical protein [Planctomycetota bacterium]